MNFSWLRGICASDLSFNLYKANGADLTTNVGIIRHSGINWNARLAKDCDAAQIKSGEHVLITGIDGNIILITPSKRVMISLQFNYI